MTDGFNTNNAYAKKYDEWRRKEEFQRLKDKYGDNFDREDDSEDSSSDSDSDEDPLLTDPKLQEDWLKTLTALKTKDPRIYQKDYHFFQNQEEESDSESEDESKRKKKKKKEKPMYLKDYERKVILEKGGVISSDEEYDDEETEERDVVTYHQEQEELRKSVVNAAGDSDDDDDGIGGGLLLKRKRTMHELEEDEKEQREWDEKQQQEEEEESKKRGRKPFGIEAEPINTWDIPNLDQREKFLKNFILGQTYADKDKNRIPTYDEVVYGDEDEDALKQEEEFLEKAEQFEKRHNFRFEEFGSSEVKSYPREIKNLVRRKDNKRTEKRNIAKERKLKEKEKKNEEIKRLKNLKRQEILSKIEKLKAVTGNDSLGFNEEDLEEDFDPSKHDEMMEKCFDEDYYAVGSDEIQKPEFEMSDDEMNWDKWAGPGPSGSQADEAELHADDPDFCMDADYDPSVKKESRKKQKRKKNKQKLDEALEQEKPVFDPNEKTFEEYINEYYNLDYEDIIDDIPCRFKYRKVTANTFGLTSDEILNSNEKELNTWVSLKKVSQYRTEDEEQYDIRAFTVKAKNETLKKRVLHSLYQRDEEKHGEEGGGEPVSGKKKRKRGKGKNKEHSSFVSNAGTASDVKEENTEPETSERIGDVVEGQETVEDGSSQVDNSKSKKKKKKKKHQDQVEMEHTEVANDNNSSELTENGLNVSDESKAHIYTGENVHKKRKNKKKKKKENGEEKQKKLNVSNARLKAYGINRKKYKTMEPKDFKFKH